MLNKRNNTVHGIFGRWAAGTMTMIGLALTIPDIMHQLEMDQVVRQSLPMNDVHTIDNIDVRRWPNSLDNSLTEHVDVGSLHLMTSAKRACTGRYLSLLRIDTQQHGQFYCENFSSHSFRRALPEWTERWQQDIYHTDELLFRLPRDDVNDDSLPPQRVTSIALRRLASTDTDDSAETHIAWAHAPVAAGSFWPDIGVVGVASAACAMIANALSRHRFNAQLDAIIAAANNARTRRRLAMLLGVQVSSACVGIVGGIVTFAMNATIAWHSLDRSSTLADLWQVTKGIATLSLIALPYIAAVAIVCMPFGALAGWRALSFLSK